MKLRHRIIANGGWPHEKRCDPSIPPLGDDWYSAGSADLFGWGMFGIILAMAVWIGGPEDCQQWLESHGAAILMGFGILLFIASRRRPNLGKCYSNMIRTVTARLRS